MYFEGNTAIVAYWFAIETAIKNVNLLIIQDIL